MLTALRNRPHAERRVLMLLRDAPLTPVGGVRWGKDMPNPTPAQLRRFADLRRVAADHGLAVQSPDIPCVTTDELRLLAWLAEAQRVAGPCTMPEAPELKTAIIACAALLDGMWMRLSPLTLYGARLRGVTEGIRM